MQTTESNIQPPPPRRRPFLHRPALWLRRHLARCDVRLLVALVTVSGVAAWLAPWQGLFCFFFLACILAATAFLTLPEGRGALTAYGLFVLVWVVSRLCLYLFEHPGAFGPALEGAVLLGMRLFTLLGLALAVPLTVTPLTLGRVLSWYLGWLVRSEAAVCTHLFRGKVRPVLGEGVWRAALALALMMAFFPRTFRTLSDLRRSLARRAPHLPLRRRVTLLGVSVLRILSVQTWDMALAVASRDLYRPQPWCWRKAE